MSVESEVSCCRKGEGTNLCDPRTLAGAKQGQNAGKGQCCFHHKFSVGRGHRVLLSACLPSLALCSPAHLYRLVVCGHLRHCLKTLATQEQVLLPPVSISVAQGSFSPRLALLSKSPCCQQLASFFRVMPAAQYLYRMFSPCRPGPSLDWEGK